MKRDIWIALALVLGLGALGAGAGFVVRPSTVTPAEIQSAVVRTPALLERAWALPAAAAFARKLDYQTSSTYCGPSSLANVFRSLGEPATSEASVVAGTGKCRAGMCLVGLTLDELAEVARARTSRTVTVERDLTPEAFQEALRKSNDPAHRYVINFLRKPIFGAGGGHHSPIGGYLEDEDLVFVLDVNRDYGPWLVDRARLFAAMNTIDGNHKRGLLHIH